MNFRSRHGLPPALTQAGERPGIALRNQEVGMFCRGSACGGAESRAVCAHCYTEIERCGCRNHL